VLTKGALRFVGETTFSALASERAHTSLFDDPDPTPHTRLGQSADLVVIAPATARVIGSYAAGISNDLLTATLLATRAPVVLAPAMHTEMWEHPAVEENLATLARRGVHIVAPEEGRLAGGDIGKGRLASPETIVEAAAAALAANHDLAGLHVLVTAGGTREPIDPVRFVGNRSSGKMGYAVATEAARRGASVTLVSGPTHLPDPDRVRIVRVRTAEEMRQSVLSLYADQDVVVKAAAVADFRPANPAGSKIHKDAGLPSLSLEPTIDILAELGRTKTHQLLVGFSAETEDAVARARKKLSAKNLDMIVTNVVGLPDSGFEADTNRAVLLCSTGEEIELPLQSKTSMARAICDRIAASRRR
jgi:phosphopantothenoylcysteine decarboxylase/phosphopantothenate--cysteine ligase